MLEFSGSRWHLDLRVLGHEVYQYLRLDSIVGYGSDIVRNQLDGSLHDSSHGIPVVQNVAYRSLKLQRSCESRSSASTCRR
jgi:hypothetical protein